MATFAWDTFAMTTKNSAHWFARCPKNAQDWLMGNLGAALSPEIYNAVVGAGGVPVPIELPTVAGLRRFACVPQIANTLSSYIMRVAAGNDRVRDQAIRVPAGAFCPASV